MHAQCKSRSFLYVNIFRMSKRELSRLVRLLENSTSLEDLMYVMVLLQELGIYVMSRDAVNGAQLMCEIKELMDRCNEFLEVRLEGVLGLVNNLGLYPWIWEEDLA